MCAVLACQKQASSALGAVVGFDYTLIYHQRRQEWTSSNMAWTHGSWGPEKSKGHWSDQRAWPEIHSSLHEF